MKVNDLLLLEDSLKAISVIRDFSVATIMKIAKLSTEVEAITAPFYKMRDQVLELKALKGEELEEANLDSPKYAIIKPETGATVVLKMEDHIAINKEIVEKAAEEVEFTTTIEFNIHEFEVERFVETDGKKKEKKMITLVPASVIKALLPYIKE